MSRKGKSLLKVIGVLYVIAIGAFLYSLAKGRARRTRPELRPVRLSIPHSDQERFQGGGSAKERFEEIKRDILEAGYRMRGPAAGLEAGQPIGAEVLAALVEANPGEVLVWDLSLIRRLAAQKLVCGEELRDADRNIMVREGDVLDEENLFRMALAYDGETGEKHHSKLWVKGSGSIIGFDLTLVFTGLNFLVLVALLYAFLWEPVTRLLDDRAKAIREDIETARSERDETESLKAEVEKELADIRDGAREMREEGRAEGEKERARLVEDGREEARRLAERAERVMQTEVEEARKQLASEVAQLSAGLAAKMLEREVSGRDHERLAEEFVRSLEGRSEGAD